MATTEVFVGRRASSSDPKWWILLAAGLASFLVAATETAVIVALPELGRELQVGRYQITWVALTPFLAEVTTILGAARIANHFGRRQIFFLGISLYTLASWCCALAPDVYSLAIFRSLHGIGSGLIFSIFVPLVVESFPVQERSRAIAWLSAGLPAGACVGPLLMGAILSFGRWPLLFLLGVPLGMLSLLIGAITMPGHQVGLHHHRPRLQSSLWLGAAAAAILGGAASWPDFRDHRVLGSFLAFGAFALAQFARLERRRPDIVRELRILRPPVVGLSILAQGISRLVQMSPKYVLAFYFTWILDFDAVTVGFLMLVFPLPEVLGSPVSSALARKLGEQRTAWASFAVVTVSLGALSASIDHQFRATTLIATAISCFGIGAFRPAATSQLLKAVPYQSRTTAGALAEAVVAPSLVLGILMANVVVPAEPDLRDRQATDAYLVGIQYTLWACTALSAAATVLLMTLRTPRADAKGDHVLQSPALVLTHELTPRPAFLDQLPSKANVLIQASDPSRNLDEQLERFPGQKVVLLDGQHALRYRSLIRDLRANPDSAEAVILALGRPDDSYAAEHLGIDRFYDADQEAELVQHILDATAPRWAQRVSCMRRAELVIEAVTIYGQLDNLSRRGACVHAPVDMPIGYPFMLRLPLDDGMFTVETARVRWIRGPLPTGGYSLGISFEDFSEHDAERVSQFVDHLMEVEKEGTWTRRILPRNPTLGG